MLSRVDLLLNRTAYWTFYFLLRFLLLLFYNIRYFPSLSLLSLFPSLSLMSLLHYLSSMLYSSIHLLSSYFYHTFHPCFPCIFSILLLCSFYLRSCLSLCHCV